MLLLREVGTYEWWGDTLEYVQGVWRPLGANGPSADADRWIGSKEYVAAPLPNDPSFMEEYSHEKQRAGFAQWRERLPD
jgi:hypothetical protein